MHISLYLTLALYFLLPLSFPASADKLRLISDVWCPYICDPSEGQPGYAVELSRQALTEHEIEVTIAPFSRALRAVAVGHYDGVLAASPAHNPDLIFPQETVGFYGNHFIVRANDDWKFHDLTSLQQMRLAAIKSYDYGPVLNDYIQRKQGTPWITLVTGEQMVERNLNMLLSEHIDVYLETEYVAFYTAKKLGLDQHFRIAGEQGSSTPLFIGFSPQSKSSAGYAREFDRGVRKLRRNGQLQKLLNKYGIKDWSKRVGNP